jgi:hypothetical protein
MSIAVLAWTLAVVLISITLLARFLRHRATAGYQRRFVSRAPGLEASEDNTANHDAAFPYAATLFPGDSGSSSPSHHHSAGDCAHTVDAGGGCSDGGGGGSH